MSENDNEQMELESGSATNENNTATSDAPITSTASPQAEVTTTEKPSSNLKLTIKTPKEKKDITIDAFATVQQVS